MYGEVPGTVKEVWHVSYENSDRFKPETGLSLGEVVVMFKTNYRLLNRVANRLTVTRTSMSAVISKGELIE
jgi:hypothetical protein